MTPRPPLQPEGGISSTLSSATEKERRNLNELQPSNVWPPPIYIRSSLTPEERYYMEYRWHSQWAFFDKKATENKQLAQRLQRIILVGSVVVPILVSIPQAVLGNFQLILYFLTLIISASVAIANALETVGKYNDNWRTYRNAAEELQQEKSMYDARASRYANNPNAFTAFVERCEEVVAQQNGRWFQVQAQKQTQAEEVAQEFVDRYVDDPEKEELGTGLRAIGLSLPVANLPQTPLQPDVHQVQTTLSSSDTSPQPPVPIVPPTLDLDPLPEQEIAQNFPPIDSIPNAQNQFTEETPMVATSSFDNGQTSQETEFQQFDNTAIVDQGQFTEEFPMEMASSFDSQLANEVIEDTDTDLPEALG